MDSGKYVSKSIRGLRLYLVLGSASPALSLAALGAILFLSTDETQTAPVLTDDPRPLNSLGEATKKLIKRF